MANERLIEGLKKLSQDIMDIAAALDDAPAPQPEKAYTYEEVRAVLAEKSRTGYRAEVKSLLTEHGVKQLSDITDPAVYAALIAEAKEIGNG